MALVDADYKFILVDIWENSSLSDAVIFNQSDLKEVIENGTIGFSAADTHKRRQTDALLYYRR